MEQQTRPKLIEARAKKHWTLEQAAEKLRVSKGSLLNWEKGKTKPFAYNVELLCKAYGMTAEELGLAPIGVETEETEATPQLSIEETKESITSHLEPLPLSIGREEILPSHFLNAQNIIAPTYGGTPHILDIQGIQSMLHRQFLQQIFNIVGTTFFIHTPMPFIEVESKQIEARTIEEFLPLCEANIKGCWYLMKGSEMLVVRSLLLTWLPPLDTLIKQPSQYQKQLASIAAQGYILAGLVAVLQQSYDGAEWCCRQAVEYSRLAEDPNLLVAALKHLATKYNSANYPLLTLHTYQEALPLVNSVSPLLRSRIYLGLALAYAQCHQKSEADQYLGLAHDTFPDNPEADPSFLYADCGLSSLNHYQGLIYSKFGHPKKAWETFAGVEKLKSKIIVPERTIIEIVNCQAEAAVAQKDMELACTHVQTGIVGARKLKSEKRFHDTYSVYKQMRSIWPHEQDVKQLEELFH